MNKIKNTKSIKHKKRVNVKVLLTLIAMIAICVSTAAYGTLAYYTVDGTATNVITAGNIHIRLDEWAVGSDGELSPFVNGLEVMPAATSSKIVEVTNTGADSAWLRITVDSAITFAEGVEGTPDASLIGYDIDTDHWTQQDGYYYYNEILKPGETTQPLFKTVIFSDEMTNDYIGGTATIEITAYAVQSAHNGSTVFEAAGWPAQD